ncbi:MAG: DUF1727 domain-containing protein [Acidimicrobiales bacterium]
MLGALSRWSGRGSGSVVGGHVVLVIDPQALRRLSAGREVLLVSGTNGKTTTTKLLATSLSASGPVVTNVLGANLPTGLVTALGARPTSAPAVLEVDEAWLESVTEEVRPSGLVLLNLSRDQLDRNNEVRQVAQRWRRACEGVPSPAFVVANADDPLVVWAAYKAERAVWVGAGLLWKGDATGCPACGGQVRFAMTSTGAAGAAMTSAGAAMTAGTGWACAECGFHRPSPEIWLAYDGAAGAELVFASGERYPLVLSLPGRCNQANAAMAVAAAVASGRPVAQALEAMPAVQDVAGRYATVRAGPVLARLLLAKNPAGWAEVFGMLHPPPSPVVIAINARTADGHDPSWLWDVAFEQLRGRLVVASGERGLDLAVRLHYADVDHVHVPDLGQALKTAGAEGARAASAVDVVANYTAFHQLLAMAGRGL